MKTLSSTLLLVLTAVCFADPDAKPDESTGFWLARDLTLVDETKKKRLPHGVTAGWDSSSAIIKISVEQRRTHRIVQGKAKVPSSGALGQTYLFVGPENLKHGDLIIPISMPDIEGRFSFRLHGALMVHLDGIGGIAIKGGKNPEYSYPSCLYIAKTNHWVKRYRFDKQYEVEQDEEADARNAPE